MTSVASVRVVAHLTAKPDQVEAAKKVAATLIEATRKEAGCLRYELLQNLAELTDLTFVEEWADAAALDAHMGAPHLAEAFKAVGPLLAAPADIRRYRLVM